ncbi:glycosyltransferase family 2 protein [Photobacterium damselae]|uniref:glycosyltransferase family 2 protein n=1 Tax=Photobacterium damselae TaxID=38293 RepID=UPI0040686A07
MIIPDISIIVPVYNVEDYVFECINSLINQTIHNIEIIVVDDGSTDASLDVISKFSDTRIKVISKRNGGLSSARNEGIKIATGKYIAFLDSDDWVEPFAYKTLLDAAIRCNSDIVICGFYLAYETCSKRITPSSIDNLNIKIEPQYLSKIKVAAWDKLYKRSLFVDNDITYPQGLYYEDTPTTIPLLLKSNSITIIDEALIYYRQRDGSITKEREFNNKCFDIYKGVDIIYSFIDNATYKDDRIKRAIDSVYVKKCLIDNIIRVSKYSLQSKYLGDIKRRFFNKNISLLRLYLSKKEFLFSFFILYFPEIIVVKFLDKYIK